MTQLICPSCRQANRLEDRFCSGCGAELSFYPARHNSGSQMTVGNGSLLPAPSLKQVGQAVAVSLVALAAEAGLMWLRRRVQATDRPRSESMALVPQQKAKGQSVIFSQRLVQVWRDGRLKGQMMEQQVWEEFE